MPTTAPKESVVTRRIITWLCTLPGAHAHKVHSGAYGGNGEPDVDAVVRGRSVKIEVKRPGNKPTKLQVAALRRWTDAGAVAFVAHSLDEVQDTLHNEGLC